MALATKCFWDNFFEQRLTPEDATQPSEALEWYISSEDTYELTFACVGHRDRCSTRILHNGCGSSELGVMLATRAGFRQVLDSDFSDVVVAQMQRRFPTHAFVATDARAMSFQPASLDIIICKGMFDSITADADTRQEAARRVVAEAARVLRPGGECVLPLHLASLVSLDPLGAFSRSSVTHAPLTGFIVRYLIFSTFGPDATDKDMRALLAHPLLVMVLETIPRPPMEIPDQPCSYLWRLQRRA